MNIFIRSSREPRKKANDSQGDCDPRSKTTALNEQNNLRGPTQKRRYRRSDDVAELECT